MACNNCFNGCLDPVSDQCVKYTGPNVPELGIESGDQLSSVEASIISYLVPVLTGAGINPIVLESHLCSVVKSYLPTCTVCTGFTLNEIITAIVRTVCDLQGQIDDIDNELSILNADYTIGCLTGVVPASNTHAIVQAVINNLCSLNTAFTAFVLNVSTTYVSVSTINSYIAAYLATATSNRASSKMVPFVPQAYYGSLSNYPAIGDSFDAGGAGQNYWSRIFICNGTSNPSVPDLRGRVLVGAVSSVPGGILPADVNPSNPLNPNYSVGTRVGANSITLQVGQIPGHTHPATSTVTDNHFHYIANGDTGGNTNASGLNATRFMNHYKAGDNSSYFLNGNATVANAGKTSSSVNAITVATTTADIGGSLAHSNVQPSVGVNWIIYIP